ncbi:FkbM family methyltransferase [Chitinophagaceae bacterium MMS25-I14]
MSLFSSLQFILKHPLNRDRKMAALIRFTAWQIRCRVTSKPYVHRFTGHSRLLIRKGMRGATGNLYCGLHEYHDMGFVLHFLRPEDLFADIGANVGSYTVLASAEAGADTIAFEPLPGTFSFLQQNISLNNIGRRVTAMQVALGASAGTVHFTTDLDTVNHVAVKGEMHTVEVPADTLDHMLGGRKPVLIKIDVEGYETEVLKGAADVLSQQELKAIIIELNGSGERYGYDERKIHQMLLQLGFAPYTYDPEARLLTLLKEPGPFNTIYIRDLAFVQDRVQTAERVSVMGRLL